jgi:hypothetical protein
MIFPRRLSVPPSEPNQPDNAPPVELQESPAPPGEVVPVAKLLPPTERDYEHVYDDDEGDDFDFDYDPRRAPPRRLKVFVRLMLVGMAVGFTALIVTALCLNPYTEDGSARTMETHRQLGLPRCNMVELTGKPCPACGMTTSFALLTHGDVLNSLKANWVGTILCGTIIVFTPWLVISAVRGRLLWVRNGEMFSTIILSTLLLLMMGRWAWIMFVN